MPPEPLRVGMIGVGGIARSEHLPHWRKAPGVTIAAVADSDAIRLAEVAAEFGVTQYFVDWRELIEQPDIDIVDIATPNCFHATMAIAALEAGKHVLCEKPMATSAADA